MVHGVTNRDPCPPLVLFSPLLRGWLTLRDTLEVFPFAPKPLVFRHLLWARLGECLWSRDWANGKL